MCVVKSIPSSAVHTIGTSVANGCSYSNTKYRRITSRKYFTSVLALKLSAYETQLMEDGKEVGKWVNNCSNSVKKGIKDGLSKIHKDVTFRDGSKKTFVLNLADYGMKDSKGNLVIHPHQRRWIRMFNCGSNIQRLENKDGEVFYEDKNHGCDDKLCMACNRKKSFLDFHKYKDVIMSEIDRPVMLVLHSRSPGVGKLQQAMNKLYSSFEAIRKQNSKDAKKGKCEKWSYYWSMEVTINSKSNTYHPHFHIIVSQHQAKEILHAWIANDKTNRQYFAHGYIDESLKPIENKKQAISEVLKDESELMEVFKYVAKISTDVIDQYGKPIIKTDSKGKKIKETELAPIPMIYEMLMATYGRRRNGSAGAIYDSKLTKDRSQAKIKEEAKKEFAKEDGFANDSEIVELCDTWKYDHVQANYIGQTDYGVRMRLSNFEVTESTKKFLRIKNDSLDEREK